jgi:hydrogenase maturation protease
MGRGILVIGLGNELRGDDGAGPWVARQVAAAGWPQVAGCALEAADPALLLDAWAGYDRVYVADAVIAPLPAGTIVRLDLLRRRQRERPATLLSSHGLGLGQAVELGRALRALPRHLVFYGIVAQDFAYGAGLSPVVEAAARQVLVRLRRAIDRCRTKEGNDA